MNKPVRTRIAPSPTGQDLHIGNAYTALINYVVAKKYGGQFIIRIEDTDQTRLVEGSEENILASLKWLGIVHDEGPFRQSERLPVYKKYADELVSKGHAYYCYCTPERLSQMREKQEKEHKPPMYDGLCKTIKEKRQGKHVIRLNVPEEGITEFTDLIRGKIRFENKLIDDQVILKSDGFPTYHLGVVVDDHLMNISHIIRGEEWISSTPKHILLYDFFEWEKPIFAHMPLLRNPDKSKLSKRKNPVWVSDYKAKGFVPEAIRNYLASLAWSYPDERDIFSTEEMIHVFDLSQIKTTAPVFDVEKLTWVNGKYLEEHHVIDFYKGKYPDNKIKLIWPLVKDRMKILTEFESLAGFFFEAPEKKSVRKEVVEALQSCAWNHDAMEKAIRKVCGDNAKEAFMELRVAVTGKTVGPPLLESLEILGKEETMARL